MIQYPPTYDSVGVQIKVTGKKTPRPARMLDTGTHSASWGKDVFVAEGQTQKFIVISAGKTSRLFLFWGREGLFYPVISIGNGGSLKEGWLTGGKGICYTMCHQGV